MYFLYEDRHRVVKMLRYFYVHVNVFRIESVRGLFVLFGRLKFICLLGWLGM